MGEYLRGKATHPFYCCGALMSNYFHDGAGRVDLELVITRLVRGRLEEQLENIIVPDLPIVLLRVSVQVAVLHVGKEINIFAVPQEACLRRRPRRPGLGT